MTSAITTTSTDPPPNKRVKRGPATPQAVQEVAKLRDDAFGRGKHHPRVLRSLPKTNAETKTEHPPTNTTITSTTAPQPAHQMVFERESPQYMDDRSEPLQLPDPSSLTSETEYQTENKRIKRSQITFSDHNLICDFDDMEAPEMSLGITKVVSDVLTGREDKPRPHPRPRSRLDGPAISPAPGGFVQENIGWSELTQSYSWPLKMNHTEPTPCAVSWPQLERTAHETVKMQEEPTLRVGREFLRSCNYDVLYDVYGISWSPEQ